MAHSVVDAFIATVPAELLETVPALHIDRFSGLLDILVAVRTLVSHFTLASRTGGERMPDLETVSAEGMAVMTYHKTSSRDDFFFSNHL